ncbi:unnamed protein product [Parajaminaea phylloscopi]
MARGKQRTADVDAEAVAYDWHYLCRFILIGDSGVGKSALLLRVTDDRFLAEEAEPTVGVEFGSVTIPLPNNSNSTATASSASSNTGSSSAAAEQERVKVQIWDTAGSEAFRGITRSYYRGAAGCLLVYDVTHRPSFTSAKTWLRDVREHAEEDACVVLVGNRSDLVEEEPERRKVTEQEARDWAKEEGILFLETSAKTGKNVQPAFEQCITEIHRRFSESQAALASAKGGATSASKRHGSAASAANLLKSRKGGPAGGRAGTGVGDREIRLDAQDGQPGRGCCVVV